MTIIRNQRAVEQKLKEALAVDRARVQIGKISRFGLLEMSRQRLRPSLASARDIVCPRCLGQGTIRGVDVLAINMIRLIEEEAIKEGTAQVIVEVPNEVASYLINEKRQAILDIERKHHIRVILLPSQHLETPNFSITRNKKEESTSVETPASYTLASKPELPKNVYNNPSNAPRPPAAVVSNINTSMAPQRQGIFKRLISTILGANDAQPAEPQKAATHTQPNRYKGHNTNNGAPRNRNRSQNRNRPPRNTQQRQHGGQQLAHTNTHTHTHSEHARHEQQPHKHVAHAVPVLDQQPKIDTQQHQQEAHTPNTAFAPIVVPSIDVGTNEAQVTPITSPTPEQRQQRRRKQNRRRNHYRKGQGSSANRVSTEQPAPTETKVDE